ncbi:ubiquitin carboxyl-terminal hydrolase 16, partial [Lecanoromycetidae sp. Uapishka_2]
MPDRPLTVITYAASASLAAVALVYFFNPNYLLDGDSSTSSASTRKKGIVGLFNPANDCFINSVLQSLAGLGDLRLYLIRELHRRELGGPEVYAAVPLVDKSGKEVDGRKLASLQSGEVTQGLKDIIDRLNERPIYKKTISAANFIRVLENAFATRISKSQQDAQELLQIVAERLSEEYHAGKEARKRSRLGQNSVASKKVNKGVPLNLTPLEDDVDEGTASGSGHSANAGPTTQDPAQAEEEDLLKEAEEGFPLEGQTEARVECQFCHFVPKASPTTFVMLNLTVPQKSSASLNDCLDAHFKTEFIEDYKCDKCRLEHAIEAYTKDYGRATSKEGKAAIQRNIQKLEEALETDPEKAPEGVELPDTKYAPKRKIARHIEITSFPKVLVMHLSRSMFDPRSSSTKNLAKLSFPEKFPMGGLLNRRNYKLLGMVTHKGTHNNGHYETFRRQHLYAPFSTPHVDHAKGPYSASAPPTPSTQRLLAKSSVSLQRDSPTSTSTMASVSSPSTHSPSPSESSASQSSPSTRPSSGSVSGATLARSSEASTASKLPPTAMSLVQERYRDQNAISKPSSGNASRRNSLDVNRFKRKKKTVDRWWRISDDRVKECKTAEVLGMQKEVYMLFYEMERDDPG